MRFYAYEGNAPLGSEKLGTEGKLVFELKTIRGAKGRCNKAYGTRKYQLYSYTNFYNPASFRKVS